MCKEKTRLEVSQKRRCWAVSRKNNRKPHWRCLKNVRSDGLLLCHLHHRTDYGLVVVLFLITIIASFFSIISVPLAIKANAKSVALARELIVEQNEHIETQNEIVILESKQQADGIINELGEQRKDALLRAISTSIEMSDIASRMITFADSVTKQEEIPVDRILFICDQVEVALESARANEDTSQAVKRMEELLHLIRPFVSVEDVDKVGLLLLAVHGEFRATMDNVISGLEREGVRREWENEFLETREAMDIVHQIAVALQNSKLDVSDGDHPKIAPAERRRYIGRAANKVVNMYMLFKQETYIIIEDSISVDSSQD